MKKWKQGLITALCVSMGAQIYVNAFINGFIITLAVILLGIFLYQYNETNPLIICFLTAFFSPFIRGLFLYFTLHDAPLVFHMVAPDVMFYVTYGIIFYVAFFVRASHSLTHFFFSVMLCDFGSNIVEMLFRTGVFDMHFELMKKLLIIAIGRSLVVLLAVIAFNQYKALLTSEEHEIRYKKLMVMASIFNSEVYFMNKNMVEIEDVMKKAFTLYKDLDSDDYPKSARILALDIAKDVHEIKKDYIRVIKGLQDNFLSDLTFSEMNIDDLLQILSTDINEQIHEKNPNITFSIDSRCNFNVQEHFAFMTILRNLVINSIESMVNKKNGYVKLTLEQNYYANQYMFTVFDNGPGINKSEINVVFEPGFSTKFDETTGAINRGIGLTLVKNLVEDTFHGQITVTSKANLYTRFLITIPTDEFKKKKV